jgi:hypothetical protein
VRGDIEVAKVRAVPQAPFGADGGSAAH